MRRGTGETDEAVYAPSLDIDTAVLRLCGKAYDESLPILYENSKFNFHSPDTINCFRVEDLLLVHSTIDERQVLPVFFAQPSCYGRVSMIRKLALYLTWRYDHEEKVTEPYCRDEDHVSEGNWAPFLKTTVHRDGNNFIAFPALEQLELVFTEWELSPNDRFVVSQFRTLSRRC